MKRGRKDVNDADAHIRKGPEFLLAGWLYEKANLVWNLVQPDLTTLVTGRDEKLVLELELDWSLQN